MAVAHRSPNACIAAADDIGATSARQVADKSWVLINPPSLLHTEIREDVFRLAESAVASTQSSPHAGIAAADKIRNAVAVQIDNEPRMFVDPP